MTPLFTSLYSAGAMPAPPEPPEPGFPWITNLLYRFNASDGMHKDDAATPAADGDGVARWLNFGSAEDALQTVAAGRPIYRTGGLTGRAYVACDRTNGGKVGFYFRDPKGAQINWLKSQIGIGDVASPQLLMAAAGRNSAGTTSSPSVCFWLRQNRAGLREATSQSSNLVSTAIAATQFLRATGLATGGYFRGRLHEFLLYDGTLDNETTFAIEDWLDDRYGLS